MQLRRDTKMEAWCQVYCVYIGPKLKQILPSMQVRFRVSHAPVPKHNTVGFPWANVLVLHWYVAVAPDGYVPAESEFWSTPTNTPFAGAEGGVLQSVGSKKEQVHTL